MITHVHVSFDDVHSRQRW